MNNKNIKKPSILGKGYLGQQTLGQRFATNQYNKFTLVKQKKPKAILPLSIDFYNVEIEGFREYNNNWAWGCCPFHPDSNPSFTMNLESGAFRCMSSSCGIAGSNIVSFVSQLHGLDMHNSLRYLENWHE